jgi:hypothetical protein
VERGAAPARVVRSHAPGRSRVTVRAHYGALPLKRLDAGRTKGGESRPDHGGQTPPVRPRKNGPANANRRQDARTVRRSRGAPQGDAACAARPMRRLHHAPRGAPLPLFEGDSKTAHPAPQKTRAMAHARLPQSKICRRCLIFESESQIGFRKSEIVNRAYRVRPRRAETALTPR